ncbi:transcriptional regulator [Nocardioides sp.]|uniref:transcriptional regulator n=1 Tax=Nocardioides sp. TaxID=35761 RepID=UPI002635C810|nr:transcriptional regulator [Nocardioides sp.]
MHIEQVRKYVLASLVCSVVMGHSLAVAVLGVASKNQGGSRQGLFVLSILFGLLGIGAARLINRASLLTPWLLCAVIVPTATYVVYFQVIKG